MSRNLRGRLSRPRQRPGPCLGPVAHVRGNTTDMYVDVMLSALRNVLRSRQGSHHVPAQGYEPLIRERSAVDSLGDHEIQRLNELLPWACFTADGQGRRVGKAASATKRSTPQSIPDERIVRLDAALGLRDKHVVELGCFEGVHTIALCDRAARVTAVDARVENVVKTLTRTWLYGHRPELALQDVEDTSATDIYECDVLHHNGVLYHLHDPVGHLRRALARVRSGLLLDTHISRDHEATSRYQVDGQSFRVREVKEFPDSPFAGMYPSARWLLLDDLRDEVRRAGFEDVVVEEVREERNGLRVLLIARRREDPTE